MCPIWRSRKTRKKRGPARPSTRTITGRHATVKKIRRDGRVRSAKKKNPRPFDRGFCFKSLAMTYSRVG